MLARQRLEIDADGVLVAIEPAAEAAADGFLALPGMVNAHSHCFQRALPGHGEVPKGADSFWSWRESMYRLANRIDPEELYAIARQAFADMLRGGFTSVGEFHYLHHARDGTPSTALGEAVVAAAAATGIRLVLLPVFYSRAGFGGTGEGLAPRAEQRRFVHRTVAEFARLLEHFAGEACGCAAHSLRAVPAAALGELVTTARGILGEAAPLHIHIAEQTLEVEACTETHGLSPVRLLAEHVELDERWSLVHATHADEAERELMCTAGVNVVLCPLTEAYLGDGIFPAAEYAARGGSLAIGSDSNVRIDAVEELRWLEYVQRLTQRRRSRLATSRGIGMPLWAGAAGAGARALGLDTGAIEVGRPADLVVLSPAESPLEGVEPQWCLDAWLTGGSAANIAAVYVAGHERVSGGCVVEDQAIREGFARALKRVWGEQ